MFFLSLFSLSPLVRVILMRVFGWMTWHGKRLRSLYMVSSGANERPQMG